MRARRPRAGRRRRRRSDGQCCRTRRCSLTDATAGAGSPGERNHQTHATLQQSVAAAPEVEAAYSSLTRDYDDEGSVPAAAAASRDCTRLERCRQGPGVQVPDRRADGAHQDRCVRAPRALPAVFVLSIAAGAGPAGFEACSRRYSSRSARSRSAWADGGRCSGVPVRSRGGPAPRHESEVRRYGGRARSPSSSHRPGANPVAPDPFPHRAGCLNQTS